MMKSLRSCILRVGMQRVFLGQLFLDVLRKEFFSFQVFNPVSTCRFMLSCGFSEFLILQ